jgi:hypothetical protein
MEEEVMSARPMFTVLLLLLALPLAAQTGPSVAPDTTRLKPATRMERAAEIALAKTAAPPVIADQASIYVLGAKGYEKAVTGTNGFGCIVQRTIAGSALIPRCDEASGVETLYAVFSLLEEMRAQGRSVAEYRDAVATGYRTGRFRAPRYGGLSYMYSTDGIFTNAQGERFVFTPHVMIYWPYCDAKDLGVTERADVGKTHLALLDAGTPECLLIVNTPPETARTVAGSK